MGGLLIFLGFIAFGLIGALSKIAQARAIDSDADREASRRASRLIAEVPKELAAKEDSAKRPD